MEKYKVTMSCKIYTDNFDHICDQEMTGTEIFDFLLKDAQCTWKQDNDDKDAELIPGDLNLWYLGCNEKFGILKVRTWVREWNHGCSSFDNVEAFIGELNKIGAFTRKQYYALCEKIIEGRKVDSMYDLTEYLVAKRDGKRWEKTETAKSFREDFKKMMGSVHSYFEKDGYNIQK